MSHLRRGVLVIREALLAFPELANRVQMQRNLSYYGDRIVTLNLEASVNGVYVLIWSYILMSIY